MKSRFWNTWTKEEAKVRSPIIIKDRDQNESSRECTNGNRKKIHQYNLSSRDDRFQLITDSSNEKLRNGHKEVNVKNKEVDDLHKQQQHLSRHRDNIKNSWELGRTRYHDHDHDHDHEQEPQQVINSRRRKSKGTASTLGNNNDSKCVEAKLTNGKLRTSNNGFTKQVKRSDESLDREHRGAKYEQTYQQDDRRNFFYDVETSTNGMREPIKFVRKFEEYECRYDDKPDVDVEDDEDEDEDVDDDNDDEEEDECYKQTRYSSSSSSSRKLNGDFKPGRSLSPLDDTVSKGCKREFIYLDKRSWRHSDEQSPDRTIELTAEENSNGINFVNGNRRNGNRCDNYLLGKKTVSDKINRDDYDPSVGKYDKIREHKKGFNLVRSTRDSPSEHNGRRRNLLGHRSLEDNNYSKAQSRDPSSKRESSRDRQIFRKISFKLKGKEEKELARKEKDIKNNSSESESIKSKPRRDNRHSRPLSPPTLENLEADEVVPRQHRKIFSLSKDLRHQQQQQKPHQQQQQHQKQQQQLRLREDSVGKRKEIKKINNHNYQHHHHRDSRDLSWIERELSSWYSSEESPEREKSKNKTKTKIPRTCCLLSDDDDDEDGDEEDDDDDDSDLGFSTRIERNGATVIRIHTSPKTPERLKSPERINDRRFQCRRTRNVSSERYTFQEDDDELEEEEDNDDRDDFDGDIKFFDLRKRSTDSFRRNFRHSNVQITDLEDGQPCLQCGETCSGFSPHTWRKNCTSCKCPKEVHDVCHEEWVSVRARLGLKGEGSNNYIGFEPRDRGLAWAPPGLPPHKVEEYFSMLPEISVPRLGTPGERHRDRQLATQLPKQDLARTYCRHLDLRHAASADDFMAARNEIALDIGSVQEVLERGHECGVCHEPLKYGSLAVMASKLGLLYHPSCFQCTQCRELLVDLAYCVHDDALYCERHYAERLKPRCAACDELIFSGEYTKAMNKDWHSGHFCCWQCDESLTGQRYVLRDEHPYCIKCYESVFANGCEECNKIIGIDSKDLSYKDKHWHEACFLCNKCRVSLVDKQFGSKVDKIYCGNCYDAQFASRCDGCGEIFRAGTKKMEYKTRQWHEKCFCCVVCKNPIGTKSFIPREQEIYCAGCYEDKFATRCVKCNKIITSGGVTYKNEPWHRDCFTCSHCNNSLAGQRFTSRDDKPYCAECFGELFAKRCTACTKPITGIGGTRFISFEDRHWHNDCFICAGCKTSLVGRGFITDGDDIICPECAKQKLSE